MTGNKNNYFVFDHGTDAFPEKEVNLKIVSEVAKVITQENPDIILLQEIDNQSQRTNNIDELKELMALLPKEYKSYSCTPYHKVNFLPLKGMTGRVQLMLCTISKYRMVKAIRHALPSKLDVSFLNQQFQPKRAILQTDIALENGSALGVFNTHFSAFASGTDTLEKQGALANEILLRAENKGPALLAGDFNALSAIKFFKRVHPDERSMHSEHSIPITPLIKNFQMFPTIDDLSSKEYQQWLTYMPSMDRTRKPYIAIDFVFITKQLNFRNKYVLQKGTRHISDHFPLVAEIILPNN